MSRQAISAFRPLLRGFLGALLFGAAAAGQSAPDSKHEYSTLVQPFIQHHCLKCHDAKSARAGFRIDLLSSDFTQGNTAGLWKEVMDKLNDGSMPPKKEPRPDANVAYAVGQWVAGQLTAVERLAQGAGGRVPLRRMNRVEYANTVRDLLQLDDHYARTLEKELPVDGKVAGFDRGAGSLFVDEAQLSQYLVVAEMVLDQTVFLEKPKVVHLTYDSGKEIYVHHAGVGTRNEKGQVEWKNRTPEQFAQLKEPLEEIRVDPGPPEVKRHVPWGVKAENWKNGGMEYLSGGNNYRNPGNLRHIYFPEDWMQKGVVRDGWYEIKVQAGAWKGEGKEAQEAVKLVLEYCYGSPLQKVETIAIDAPLDAPREYVFRMYLEHGPAEMKRTWSLGWDNGNKDVAIHDLKYNDIQWKPVSLAEQVQKAIVTGKSKEDIDVIKKKVEEAHAAARKLREEFEGPYYVWDPKLDILKRPRVWIGRIELTGPIAEWPPEGRKVLFPKGETRNDDDYLRELILRFMARAFRRPVTPEERDGIIRYAFKTKADRNLSLVQAFRKAVKVVLCSPGFLYLEVPTETSSTRIAQNASVPARGAVPIDSWRLANRMSYFLWSSMPDAELLGLAENGTLRSPHVLKSQVKRMIADPRSAEFVRSFAGQWLSVRNFENGTPPNRDVYRNYDDALKESSRREPLEFFSEILRNDLSVFNFLNSDFLMIDERLAKHYGITGVKGDAFRRVPAPSDGHRGGVLGMAGLLTYLADGTRTLPIRRAAWVLDTLWNSPPPPPPPNAGDLPAIKGKKLTVRERLDQHRTTENCASCHSRIDAFGLALENYDAVGHWRDRQNGEGMKGEKGDPTIDAGGHFPGGQEWTTLPEYKAALLAEKDKFLKGFSEKLLTYALGRPLSYADHAVVEDIMASATKNDFRIQAMLQAIVTSRFFLTE
jgi:hypothetical protein